jgi:hypothetical protein
MVKILVVLFGASSLLGSFFLGRKTAPLHPVVAENASVEPKRAMPPMFIRSDDGDGVSYDEIRQIVREELAAAHFEGNANEAHSTTQPAPITPEAQHAEAEAAHILDAATSAHRWTNADRTAFVLLRPNLSGKAFEEMNLRLIRGLNQGLIRSETEGSPLDPR